MKTHSYILHGMLALGILGIAARASDEPTLNPRLDPNPAILAALEKLEPNQSTWLPAAAVTGPVTDEMKAFGFDKRGPHTRNYCRKWVWAADRKRALFCGENAGAPHRLNDVWEYDLAANTWVLLHPADADFLRLTPQRKLDIGTVTNGILVTKTGAPYDPVHTWWQLTYDPDMHAMLWVMGNYNKCGHPYKNKAPWGKLLMFAYYPYEQRWDFNPPKSSYPMGMNASILEYMPDRKKVLWFTNTWRGNETAYYDGQSNTWKIVLGKEKIKGNPDCPGSEAIAAYDSVSRKLVVHWGGGTSKGKPRPTITYSYDPEAKKWKRLFSSLQGPKGMDMWASMTFDSRAARCFIVDGIGLWSYAIGEEAWTFHTPDGPKAPNGMLCYHPVANVLMVNVGSKVWVYRAPASPSPPQARAQ